MFRRRAFGQSAQHQMAEAGFDNRLAHMGIRFVVAARYAAVFAEPAEGALHDPAPGQHHEAFGAGRGLLTTSTRRPAGSGQPTQPEAGVR